MSHESWESACLMSATCGISTGFHIHEGTCTRGRASRRHVPPASYAPQAGHDHVGAGKESGPGPGGGACAGVQACGACAAETLERPRLQGAGRPAAATTSREDEQQVQGAASSASRDTTRPLAPRTRLVPHFGGRGQGGQGGGGPVPALDAQRRVCVGDVRDRLVPDLVHRVLQPGALVAAHAPAPLTHTAAAPHALHRCTRRDPASICATTRAHNESALHRPCYVPKIYFPECIPHVPPSFPPSPAYPDPSVPRTSPT